MLSFLKLSMCLGALQCYIASAMPVNDAAAFDLVPRDFGPGDAHTYHVGGNLNVSFSDHKVNWGTFPPSYTVGMMRNGNICPAAGICFPETVNKPSQFLTGNGGSAFDGTIHITYGSAQYTKKQKENLIEAFAAAVREVTHLVYWTPAYTCPNPMGYCPQPSPEKQHFAPKNFEVILHDGKHKTTLAVSTDITINSSSGLCQSILTGISAVAGAVHGAAGGVFTLGSLLCGLA